MSKTMNAYPSIDKPWLKFYTPEVVNGDLPECTIYDFMMQNNKDHPSDIAINYLGNKITYGDLLVPQHRQGCGCVFKCRRKGKGNRYGCASEHT